MREIKHLAFSILLAAFLFAAPQLHADILVDRPIDSSLPRTLNLAPNDQPSFRSYILTDITFGQNVVVDSVTTFFDDTGTSGWTTLNNPLATLNIFSDPLTAANDPQNGLAVSVSIAFTPGNNGPGVLAVTANSFAPITLTAGNYWIGLTPQIDNGFAPPNFYYNSATTGFNGGSLFRNPSGFFNGDGNWQTDPNGDGRLIQGAIKIEGEVVPEPSAVAILALGSLLGLRRRR